MTRRLIGLGLCLAAAFRAASAAPAHAAAARGTYAMVEASFELPEVRERFFETNVWTELTRPSGGTLLLPAFFDGTNAAGRGVWRVRHTPSEAGAYRLTVLLGEPARRVEPIVAGFTNREFVVSGPPSGRGFVRIGPASPRQFRLHSGDGYYPIGFNAAWHATRETKPPALFAQMRAAGLNWARMWMTHYFKSTNLDWVWRTPIAPGTLDLTVARRWDEWVRAAESNDVRIQLVLQHHTQFSAKASPDWRRHPWNVLNGGFLDRPEAFFTDARALELTRMKWRYIVARWGYSPAIMAWELFNEVELTDACTGGVSQTVIRWHEDMAGYLRGLDRYGHLVTSSSPPLADPLWRTMDYYQRHAYPQDPVAELTGSAQVAGTLAKPFFYGEMGRSLDNLAADDGRNLRCILWPSLMADGAGAAQYWSWTAVEKNDLWRFFRAATGFAAMTGLLERRDGSWLEPTVDTDARTGVSFGGGGWTNAPNAEIAVPADGRPLPAPAPFSSYVHGAPDKLAEGYPGAVVLVLRARRPVTVSATVVEVSHFGGGVAVDVDGDVAATNAWATTEQQVRRRRPVPVSAVVSAAVPAGEHRVRIAATGPDWFRIGAIHVADYVPALSAVARGSATGAVLWVVNRPGIDYPPLPDPKTQIAPEPGPKPAPATGTIGIPGLVRGLYDVMWWDTREGRELSRTRVNHAGGILSIVTPALDADAAAWVSAAPAPAE